MDRHVDIHGLYFLAWDLCHGRGREYSLIDEHSGEYEPVKGDGAIINAGAVLAVLLGFPSLFIGLYGAAGVVTGQKLIAGALGMIWGFSAAAGAYELLRRKFDWDRGRHLNDYLLFAGTFAVSTGLMISGALQETMPALAVIPALSAVKQARDGHDNHLLTIIHGGLLSTGIIVGIWFYNDGVVGSILIDRIAALP